MTKFSNPSNVKHSNSPVVARRDLIKMPLALAAGALAAPLLGVGSTLGAEPSTGVSIAPNYFPRKGAWSRVKLKGKLAVITGASRGIGRAIGESLVEQKVDVIGTSRLPEAVPDPPDFPLLALDITNPDSVFLFLAELQSHPLFQEHGQVDILVNNAARFTIGRIVPHPADFAYYLAQRDLGLRTTYFGHVMVTNALLPMMPQQSYSRIVFTVSIAGYITAALLPVGSFQDVYGSSKAALRCYANNLDGALALAGSSIRVSTVNPYFVNTAGLTHPNPIYTQPVNEEGLSGDDGMFNAAITFLRGLQANGLPASMVGEAYAQLLGMEDPYQNIVVASQKPKLAQQGANHLIEPEILAENLVSAVPFV